MYLCNLPCQMSLTSVRCHQSIKKIEEKIWGVALDIHVWDFAMDPTQDLLVLIEEPSLYIASLLYNCQIWHIHSPSTNITTHTIRIYLCSLTTGDSRHRLVPQLVILIHDPEMQNVQAMYTLQVCDNLLSIFVNLPYGTGQQAKSFW
jgi:hypothetical protein